MANAKLFNMEEIHMKKIFAVALAVVMMMSVMAITAFAADTTVMLEVGPSIDNLADSERVDIAKTGTYTLKVEANAPINGNASSTFMSIKIAAGNVSQNTALPNGTTITLKSVKLGDTEVAVKAGSETYTVAGGTLDFMLKFMDFGYNANIFDGDLPDGFTTVEVVIDVVNPESPAEDAAPAEDTTAPAEDTTAPAEDTTAPAEDTTAPSAEAAPSAETAPAENTTPANTGIVLAVLPMAVAAAAVVVSKRK